MHPIERLRYVARASGAGQEALVRETAAALATFADDPAALVTACRRILQRQPASGPLLWLAARVLVAGDPVAAAWEAAGELAADPTPTELAHALPEGSTVVVLGQPELLPAALARRGDVEVLAVGEADPGWSTGGRGPGRGLGAGGLAERLRAVDVEVEEVPAAGLGSAVVAATLVLLEPTAVGPDEALAVPGSRAAAAVARHAGVLVWAVAGVGRTLPGSLWPGLRTRALGPDEPWEADVEVVPLDLVDVVAGPAGLRPVAEATADVTCPAPPELF